MRQQLQREVELPTPARGVEFVWSRVLIQRGQVSSRSVTTRASLRPYPRKKKKKLSSDRKTNTLINQIRFYNLECQEVMLGVAGVTGR